MADLWGLDLPPCLSELSVKWQIYGGLDLPVDLPPGLPVNLPPGLPELSVKLQIYGGGRSATWSAKFEHTLHFMLYFTEVFLFIRKTKQ